MYFDGFLTDRPSRSVTGGTRFLVGQSHSDRKVFEVSDTLKIHKIDVSQCAEHTFEGIIFRGDHLISQKLKKF